MAEISYFEQIKNRIAKANKGSVFVISDFLDIAEHQTVRKVLTRLENDGSIKRVLRGVYYNPEYNNLLKEYVAPYPDIVAHALARNYGWTIVPCGDTALNLLGISTQIPSVWLYVSDGRYKEYKYDNTIIKFQRTTNREISKLSYKTALIIQAIRVLGQKNIDKIVVDKISMQLTKSEKEKMLVEAKTTAVWVYEIIKQICRGTK